MSLGNDLKNRKKKTEKGGKGLTTVSAKQVTHNIPPLSFRVTNTDIDRIGSWVSRLNEGERSGKKHTKGKLFRALAIYQETLDDEALEKMDESLRGIMKDLN